MPTYSKITLNFTADFETRDRLYLTFGTNYANPTNANYVWRDTRNSAYEVTTGTPTATPGERTAINFKAAFDLDFPTGYTTSIVDVTKVVIESETLGENFYTVTDITENGELDFNIEDGIDNYVDEADIEAGLITGYIPKYYIEYCDDFGTQRNVYILKYNYTGGMTELTGQPNPVTLSYDSSEDFKFSPIRPSTADINIILNSETGVNLDEFWTIDERDFKVEVYKSTSIDWTGFLITDGLSYNLTGNNYEATLTFADGLGNLEHLKFVDDNDKPYGNQDLTYNNGFEFPFILIFTEILRKLGLDLDLWTCVDSYETNMTKTGDTRDADPLANAYVNVKTYIKEGDNENIPYWYGSGEEWNCKEVLENCLNIFGAKVYQEGGVWRIKTINADADYGTGATQRYWRKYNTLAVYLPGYEAINDVINIPCDDDTKFLIENNHNLSMDYVYKAFRMNYEYTFLRDGDTPINLAPDLCNFSNTSILAAPNGWFRNAESYSQAFNTTVQEYMRLQEITIPFADAGGFTCGIEIGTQKTGIPTSQGSIDTTSDSSTRACLRMSTPVQVQNGDKLSFKVWHKYRAVSPSGNVAYFPVYTLNLYAANKTYNLTNAIVNNQRTYQWREREVEIIEDVFGNQIGANINQIWFYLPYTLSKNTTSANTQSNIWREFDLVLPEPPEDGYLELSIYGLAADSGRKNIDHPAFTVYNTNNIESDVLRAIISDWVDEGGDIPRLQIAGLVLGKIPNENELPNQYDYIYNNNNVNYSLEVEPITVYNGDLQDENHVSNIIVPSNNTGGKNFWDDLSDTYGTSSLGLLTVREIMRQYQKPYRVFEGDVKVQDARFGAVYTFSAIPDVRFIMLRGSFNKQKQYIEDATFVQITDDELPSGGTEGGNTLDPIWENTGVFYCELDGSAENTGYVITQQVDTNPNSETYQETREVKSDSQDLTACPLGTPRKYFWGSGGVTVDINDLEIAPFYEDGTEVQVDFSNEDGNYLYFVYLKSIGLVDRVYTDTSPNNVIADWVALSDTTISGYTYRVMRTDYVMTEFSNFTHNFNFV